METQIRTKRIYRYEDNDTTKEKGRIVVAKAVIDLYNVAEYEEYKGDLFQDASEYRKTPMTVILVEYNLTFEWRVFLIDFEDFHKIMTDFRSWQARQEGNIKLN